MSTANNSIHLVVQGDCFLSIAARHRTLRDILWSHGENADLVAERKHPHALLPGDRVAIPKPRTKDESCALETTNRFQLKAEAAVLRMRLLDMGEPLSNVPFTLEVESEVIEGSTDGNGMFEVEIPPTAREARLKLTCASGVRDHRLALGGLDPKSTSSGAQGRLSNLGYRPGPVDRVTGPKTEAALRQFQHDQKLSSSGTLDAATETRLQETYGG